MVIAKFVWAEFNRLTQEELIDINLVIFGKGLGLHFSAGTKPLVQANSVILSQANTTDTVW